MAKRKTAAKKKEKARDIGVDVQPPKKSCEDVHCPFHGRLSVRGRIIEGEVVSDTMSHTVIVKKEYTHYLKKYERYERRTSRYPAHNPPCINAKKGDKVKIMECRPLAKTVSFVVIEAR